MDDCSCFTNSLAAGLGLEMKSVTGETGSVSLRLRCGEKEKFYVSEGLVGESGCSVYHVVYFITAGKAVIWHRSSLLYRIYPFAPPPPHMCERDRHSPPSHSWA